MHRHLAGSNSVDFWITLFHERGFVFQVKFVLSLLSAFQVIFIPKSPFLSLQEKKENNKTK